MNSQPNRETSPAAHHATYEVTLGSEQDSLADRLQVAGDELQYWSEATVVDHHIQSVPLDLGDESRIPPQDALLSYRNTITQTGDHSSIVTIPTLVMARSGKNFSDDNEMGYWHTPGKANLLDHESFASALEPIMLKAPRIKRLFDTAGISNRVFADALWGDLTDLSDEWKTVSGYSSLDYAIAGSLHPQTIRGKQIDSSYISSVESVISVAHTPTTLQYSIRVGTDTPLLVDPSIVGRGSYGSEPIEVNKEFHYTSIIDKKTNMPLHRRAVMSIGSTALSADSLNAIALRSSIDLHGTTQAAQIYQRAIDSVVRGRLT